MLVKAVLVFLLAMAALGMVARALGLGGRNRPPRVASSLCRRCGRLLTPGEPCVCLVTGHGWKDPASLAAVADTVESPVVEGAEVLDWLRANVYQAGMVR